MYYLYVLGVIALIGVTCLYLKCRVDLAQVGPFSISIWRIRCPGEAWTLRGIVPALLVTVRVLRRSEACVMAA
jgi:hypothetical protein